MTLAEMFRSAAELYEPDDAIGLTGLLVINGASIISAIGVIVVGVITVRGQRRGIKRWKGDRQMLDDVHKQTVNDHAEEDNFREQVDRIERQQTLMAQAVTDLTGVVSEVRGRQIDQGQDIGGIRDDVGELRGADRAARADHDDLVRRLNAFIRREHPGADPL